MTLSFLCLENIWYNLIKTNADDDKPAYWTQYIVKYGKTSHYYCCNLWILKPFMIFCEYNYIYKWFCTKLRVNSFNLLASGCFFILVFPFYFFSFCCFFSSSFSKGYTTCFFVVVVEFIKRWLIEYSTMFLDLEYHSLFDSRVMQTSMNWLANCRMWSQKLIGSRWCVAKRS